MAVIGPVVDGWGIMADALTEAAMRVLPGGKWELKIRTEKPLSQSDLAAIQYYSDGDLQVQTVIAGSNHGGSDTLKYLAGVDANEVLIGGAFIGAGAVVTKMTRFIAGIAALGASAALVRFTFDDDGGRASFSESVREFGAAAGAASQAVVWPWLILVVALVAANEYRKRR